MGPPSVQGDLHRPRPSPGRTARPANPARDRREHAPTMHAHRPRADGPCDYVRRLGPVEAYSHAPKSGDVTGGVGRSVTPRRARPQSVPIYLLCDRRGVERQQSLLTTVWLGYRHAQAAAGLPGCVEQSVERQEQNLGQSAPPLLATPRQCPQAPS